MSRNSKAHFLYKVVKIKDHDVVFVIDQNLGGRTVTSDMHYIAADLVQAEKLNTRGFTIIYRDSEEKWDGWSPDDGFFPLCYPAQKLLESILDIEFNELTHLKSL